MNRPWQIWLTFAACLAVALAAFGWLSIKALETDAAESEARQRAAQEENVRLALWRMDSKMSPLVAQESALPYFVFNSFYSAERAYGRMFNNAAKTTKSASVDEYVPSPLLLQPTPQVLLHFQFNSQNQLTSPEVPAGKFAVEAVPADLSEEQFNQNKKQLAALKSELNPAEVFSQLPAAQAAMTSPLVAGAQAPVPNANASFPNPQPVPPANANLAAANNDPFQGDSANANGPAEPQQSKDQPGPGPQQQVQVGNLNQTAMYQPQASQGQRAIQEFQARQRSVSQNNSFAQNSGINLDLANAKGNSTTEVQMSVMAPLWMADHLVLARRVEVGGEEYLQGCLLDWPTIKEQLLAGISDLLPQASLAADSDANPTSSARRLASLPVTLLPGPLPDLVSTGLSPIRLSLLLAWAAMAFAAVAAAVLLSGVISLSERRGAFVSAVTHELRTPLTTFRMYAEMLSEGMVNEEADRHKYLETLRVEADRLTHLVTNVLAYARLERGRPGGRIEVVTLEKLLDVATQRLTDRANQASLSLSIESHADAQHRLVRADPAIVEQILFNLVDNACKYAAATTDRALQLSVVAKNNRVGLRLRDHGPGISAAGQRRLFQPFRKSAQAAAYSAPGVGLGLSLSRRLARDMHGDLCYEPLPDGACFVLWLPLAG